MKKFFISIFSLAFIVTGCDSDDESNHDQGSCEFINFKYYGGTQDYLGELSKKYILVGVNSNDENEIQDFISRISHFDQSYDYTIHDTGQNRFKEIPLKLNSAQSCGGITRIISDLEEHPIVAYAHYTMQTDSCENGISESIGSLCVNTYGSNFYVKVFDENDLSDLNQMITATNTELVRQNEFMPKWFELRAIKTSKGDALAMANYFYESELFEHCEPGIGKYAVE